MRPKATRPSTRPPLPITADSLPPAVVTRDGVYTWLVVGGAVVVRVVYFVEYAISPLMGAYGTDDVYYLSWAGRMAAGDWLGSQVFEQGPLYPYLLAVVLWLMGPRVGVVLVLQMLSGAAVAWMTYRCGQRLFDRATGLAAGLTAAVYGPLVFYECTVMKSFLSPLLTITALAAGLRYGEARNPRYAILAGLAVGLACLVQEYHVLLLTPLALWIWLDRPPMTSWRKRASHLAILVASALVCIVPSTLRNWVVAGEVVLVTAGGGEAFYIAQGSQAKGFYNPPDFVLAAAGGEHEDFRREAQRRTGRELTRGESSRYWFREGLRAMAADPARTVGLSMSKAAILLNDYDVPDSQSYAATRAFVPALWVLPGFGWVAGLGLVGAALCLRSWRSYVLPLGFVAAHVVPILVFYNFGRFRIGMMPVWIVLGAHAAVWIARGLRRAGPERTKAALAGLLAAAITAAAFYPLLADDYGLSDRLSIARLAVRGRDDALAERELLEVARALEQVPVEESQSIQYLAVVGQMRQMLLGIYVRGGDARRAVEQARRVRQMPLPAEHREPSRRAAALELKTLLQDERIASDADLAELVRQEVAALESSP